MARLHYLHEQRHIHSNWLVTRKTRSVSAGRRELGVGLDYGRDNALVGRMEMAFARELLNPR